MKKFLLKLGILGIALALAVSCEPNPVLDGERDNGSPDFSVLSDGFQPPSGGYFGTFYSLRTYKKHCFSEFTEIDTSAANIISEIGPTNASAVYIGDNLMIDYCKINGQNYQELTFSGRTHYYSDEPLLFLGNEGNIFEWSINNHVYRDSLVYNAPEITISSPTFMQVISKNQGLTITWEPSATLNDAVEISLAGLPTITEDLPPSGQVSYYSSGIIDDNGSFTIPAEILSSFSEPKAIISLSRGTYKESIHNNQKYFFLIYTGYEIDILLQ